MNFCKRAQNLMSTTVYKSCDMKSGKSRRICLCIQILLVISIFLIMLNEVDGIAQAPFMSDEGSNSHIPMFRPLKRLIRNFYAGRTASVTLVFHRSVMPRIRWFRMADHSLPYAEIPNMISIEGDRRYRIRHVTSYDVTAVTLMIVGLPSKFPVKLATCFGVDSLPFQYQLDTIVEEPTDYSAEELDGIIWMRTPRPTIMFGATGLLTVVCKVQLDSESKSFTDELNIYRNFIDTNRKDQNIQMSSNGCGKMHKDRDNYTEESGKYKYKGYRSVIAGHRDTKTTLLEVTFQVLNGSLDDVGVYTCATERVHDRTYVSSWVRLAQPAPPVMIFLPCEGGTVPPPPPSSRGAGPASRRQFVVELIEGRESCVRCRAYSHEASPIGGSHTQSTSVNSGGDGYNYLAAKHPPIELLKDGELVTGSNANLVQDSHLNVADGGLFELTITFPIASAAVNNGVYSCRIANRHGTDTIDFRVVVIPDKSSTG